MGFFNDLLGFESLNLKSMWNKARKNPEQLLLGAATPAGAALWGGITGKKYDPMVNALGGPMGGGPLGTDNTGGVYDEAQAKGINTGNIAMSHDIAELVASIYGGKAAMGGLGKAAGSFGGKAIGAGSAAGQGAAGYAPAAGDVAALEAAGASAANAPAAGSWAQGAAGMAPKAGFNWQQGLQMGQGLLGQSQQPPPQSPPPQQQTQQSDNRRLQIAMRLQELRAKPMKTEAEKLEMQELMKNPMGLL